MAQPIACDLCGQENAVLMQTNIGNGDVIAIGGSCMVTFLLSTAATILDEMPADAAAAYGEVIRPVVNQLAVHVTADSPEVQADHASKPPEVAASDTTADAVRHWEDNDDFPASAAADDAKGGMGDA